MQKQMEVCMKGKHRVHRKKEAFLLGIRFESGMGFLFVSLLSMCEEKVSILPHSSVCNPKATCFVCFLSHTEAYHHGRSM